MTDIPKELKNLRYEQDLTQQEAADMCGVSVGTWQSWEQGRHCPNAEKLDHVRSTLNPRNKNVSGHVKKDGGTQTTLPLLSVSAEAGSSSNLWQTAITSYMSVDRSVISTETGADTSDNDRYSDIHLDWQSQEAWECLGQVVRVMSAV